MIMLKEGIEPRGRRQRRQRDRNPPGALARGGGHGNHPRGAFSLPVVMPL